MSFTERARAIYQRANKLSGGSLKILQDAFRSFREARGAEAAAGMAYYAFFSLFPLLIALVAAGSLSTNADACIKGLPCLPGTDRNKRPTDSRVAWSGRCYRSDRFAVVSHRCFRDTGTQH
jgi:hypothetical protein